MKVMTVLRPRINTEKRTKRIFIFEGRTAKNKNAF